MGIMDEIDIRTGRLFFAQDAASTLMKKITQNDTTAGKYKGQLFITEYN